MSAKITVNGREHKWGKPVIIHEDVAQLAFPGLSRSACSQLTITYDCKYRGGGTLGPDPISVHDGVVFDAVFTGRA